MQIRLGKVKSIGFEALKYGVNSAKIVKNLDDLLLGGDIYAHKRLLLSLLSDFLGKDLDNILLLASSAESTSDLCEISLRIEALDLFSLRLLLLFSTYYGSLVSAEYIRQVYLSRIVNDKFRNPVFSFDVAISLLELGDWEGAFNFIFNREFLFKYWSPDVMNFCQYLLGSKDVYSRRSVGNCKQWNQSNLAKPVSECKFLIEGPSKDETMLDKHTSFDYILKTNYIPDKDKDLNKYILYYNYRKFSDYELDIVNFSRCSGYVCLKSDSQLLRLKDQVLTDNVRSFVNARPVLFRQHESDPMAVQNILYDLIVSGATDITLTAIDGYSGKHPYSEKYQNSDPKFSHLGRRDNIARALRLHDPFSNFSFVQNLVKSGRISVSPLVSNIFTSERQMYAKSINALYGDQYVY